MSLNSAQSASPRSPFEGGQLLKPQTLKENYERYRACGIKLHLLADQCPETIEQQDVFELQQSEYLSGQLAMLADTAGHDIISKECLNIMMSIWADETVQGQEDADLKDTDRIVLKVFQFIQKYLNNNRSEACPVQKQPQK